MIPQSDSYTIHHGESLKILSSLPEDSVDSIVTDPPYGLSAPPDPLQVMSAWVKGEEYQHKKRGFMGHKWDAFVPGPSYWKEALRVLKPGGYGLVFAGSRTQDWMSMSLRFAGFEVVDTIMWVYSQGMPKSLNISKAIDKHLGAKRQVIGRRQHPTLKSGSIERKDAGHFHGGNSSREEWDITAPATEQAMEWDGWGTQLKPSYEPILLVRKPFKGTFAKNVLRHGVGGLHIDACRVPIDTRADASQLRTMNRSARGADINGQQWGFSKSGGDQPPVVRPNGRWPGNLVHDGSDEVLGAFPDAIGQKSDINDTGRERNSTGRFNDMGPPRPHNARHDVDLSAGRFFYCAKPSTRERHLGLDHPGAQFKHGSTLRSIENSDLKGNTHPTLKPIALMEWLVKMITPKGGVILDLFCGSGTTGMAAIKNGFRFIGIDKEIGYVRIAHARCAYAYQLLTGTPSKRAIAKTKPKKRYRRGDQMVLPGVLQESP